MGVDYNMHREAVQAPLGTPWMWIAFGPAGGPFNEAMSRICPVCAALVVNEDNLLRHHVAWHQARGDA